MLNYDAQDLQYLQMMQENITRMAENSANAKTWLVTIVTGFFAIGCSIKDLDWWLLLAIIPIIVFWYIDAYYLRLERALRNREQKYINLMNSLEDTGDNSTEEKRDALFDFRPLFMDNEDNNARLKRTKYMMLNKSVYPVYLIMLFMIIVATVVINTNTLLLWQETYSYPTNMQMKMYNTCLGIFLPKHVIMWTR